MTSSDSFNLMKERSTFLNKMDFIFIVFYSESNLDSIARVRPKAFKNDDDYNFERFQYSVMIRLIQDYVRWLG